LTDPIKASFDMEKATGIPSHVAIIMDGNGRWAEQRGLSRLEGHRAGVRNIRPVVKRLDAHGVKFVTLYAFSTENWNRPADEVNGLFELLLDVIGKEARALHRNKVRICHIGSLEGLSEDLKKKIREAVKLTEKNKGMTLGVAFNYGGRAEILEAVRCLVADRVLPGEVVEEKFERYLYTRGFPDVDLMVRTSGEMRTSNFLIWQAAYAEYYFTPVLWPDFNVQELDRALEAYSQRRRRFGRLG
jgi:undecaprenyl diphosphate synthase